MIDTIIFDMGMVLIDFRWRELFCEMGFEGERFERLANATVLNPVWNEFDRGVWSDEQMLEAFIKNAPELEEDLKILMYDRFTELLKKFDYTDGWLDALKAHGYKIYILSNFSRKGIEDCGDELDYMKKADGAVVSYTVNLIKPDPKIYEVLIDRYSINPETAVFIDDNEDNIEAAKKFGLNVILFKGKKDADEKLAKLGVIY